MKGNILTDGKLDLDTDEPKEVDEAWGQVSGH